MMVVVVMVVRVLYLVIIYNIDMCDNWEQDYAKQFTCKGEVLDSGDGEFVDTSEI